MNDFAAEIKNHPADTDFDRSEYLNTRKLVGDE